MYKAIFDDQGNRLTTYVEGLHADIPAEAIPITEEEQALYVTGEYIRDMETGQPMRKPIPQPTPEELQQASLDALDEKYAAIFDALTLAWAIAAMDGNDTIAAARKADKEAAKLQYLAEMEAILNG
ncbi:MAG TPA: hypothetical protein PKA10_07875 [Selenomonadales bacterium]|nr:hypothetical protein [Selenomonadales bacterium]